MDPEAWASCVCPLCGTYRTKKERILRVGAILGASIGSEAEHEELEADLAALEAEFDLDARMQAQPTITGEKRPRDPLEFVDKRSHASAATELTGTTHASSTLLELNDGRLSL